MSVTFSIVGEVRHCENYCEECSDQDLNLSQGNARLFLEWLSLPSDELELYGQARATELAKYINLVLAAGPTGMLPSSDIFYFCRPIGNESYKERFDYLSGRATKLLALCKRAGDLGRISWG